MYDAFLKTPKTIAQCDRDFIKWHGGVSHYGFWAVVVNDLNWLELFYAARSLVKQFIHPGYQRAPHITIVACGLLDQKHFSTQRLECQLIALTEAMINPFSLNATSLGSFTTAPYITVEDPTGSLNQIRELLSTISKEDNPVPYQPHVTIGLYRDAFDTQQVAECLQAFQRAPAGSMLVTELVFCAYETKEIQGPISILERVKLNYADPV
ncbi:MAG: 2'-5' RNA ligase family protein [Deltaproteobacteria bacterium]|nr:2'-5' RNA ligase family protein [Deltaproteobacteria bacterium]